MTVEHGGGSVLEFVWCATLGSEQHATGESEVNKRKNTKIKILVE